MQPRHICQLLRYPAIIQSLRAICQASTVWIALYSTQIDFRNGGCTASNGSSNSNCRPSLVRLSTPRYQHRFNGTRLAVVNGFSLRCSILGGERQIKSPRSIFTCPNVATFTESTLPTSTTRILEGFVQSVTGIEVEQMSRPKRS